MKLVLNAQNFELRKKKETCKEEIKVLTGKFKEAETFAEVSERLVAKLRKTVDDLEEKLKCIKKEHF